ncbi:hypothetical protein [Brenneria uluponensis]
MVNPQLCRNNCGKRQVCSFFSYFLSPGECLWFWSLHER